jgi:hypothetical protein
MHAFRTPKDHDASYSTVTSCTSISGTSVSLLAWKRSVCLSRAFHQGLFPARYRSRGITKGRSHLSGVAIFHSNQPKICTHARLRAGARRNRMVWRPGSMLDQTILWKEGRSDRGSCSARPGSCCASVPSTGCARHVAPHPYYDLAPTRAPLLANPQTTSADHLGWLSFRHLFRHYLGHPGRFG